MDRQPSRHLERYWRNSYAIQSLETATVPTRRKLDMLGCRKPYFIRKWTSASLILRCTGSGGIAPPFQTSALAGFIHLLTRNRNEINIRTGNAIFKHMYLWMFSMYWSCVFASEVATGRILIRLFLLLRWTQDQMQMHALKYKFCLH